MAFNPDLHPRGPDGKFSDGPGMRGSQRRLPRLGEALGKAVRSVFVGDSPPKPPSRREPGQDPLKEVPSWKRDRHGPVRERDVRQIDWHGDWGKYGSEARYEAAYRRNPNDPYIQRLQEEWRRA